MKPIRKFLKAMKSHWRALTAIATWLTAILGNFLVPPAYSNSGMWENFGRFGIAAITGLLIVAFVPRSKREHAMLWVIVSAIALIVGVAVWMSYMKRMDVWTEPYSGQRVVIGEHELPDAQRYQRDNGFTTQELIMEMAGATERIWPTREIAGRRFVLCELYLASLATLSIAFITLMQALQCAGKPKNKRSQQL